MPPTTSNHPKRIVTHEHPAARILLDWLRRFAIVLGPAGAMIAMWFHPHAHDDAYASLSPVVDTFVWTHVLLFASLAVSIAGIYLVTAGYPGLIAIVGRIGLAGFAAFYLGYVAVVGVAKGLVIQAGQGLSEAQQAGVAEVVQVIHTDQLLFAVGAIGAVGYLIAVTAFALALYRADAPRVPLAFFLASIVAIAAHQDVFAVAGMGSLLIALVWLEVDRTTSRARAVTADTSAS